MLIRIGYDIIFELPKPTPMLTMLNVHPSRFQSLVRSEQLQVSPYVPMRPFSDCFGNSCFCFVAPAGKFRLTNDAVVSDNGLPDAFDPGAQKIPVMWLMYIA